MGEVEFGRYRLIELLGRGGMGEVWRARDTAANNRTVAIKLLPPHLAGDDTFVARFRREADAAAQLSNPHIIPIHQYGEIDGRLYVDMRLIEGRDLQEVLNEGPLEPARAVQIIEQVAKALQAAHKVGLVHRDVKPSNILLDDDDFAYLIDFGIARGADQTGLTGTGGVIGSWPYMSPERLRAGQVDARSDIYALACVLYECLTGHTPYPGDNFEQQMTAHLMDPPPRPSSTDPHVPPQVDDVIATGMAKDPDQRYSTTVELADAARGAITDPLPRPTPDSTTVQQSPPAEEKAGQNKPTETPPGASASAATPQSGDLWPTTDATQLGSAAPEHADRLNQSPTQLAQTRPLLPLQPPPATTTEVRRLSRAAKIALVAGVIIVAAGIVAVVEMGAFGRHQSPTPAPSQSAAPAPATPSTAGPQITIEENRLIVPASVSPGAHIIVANKDSVVHTLVSDETTPNKVFGPLPVFEVIPQPNSTATFTAPTKPGSYPFHDYFIPSMRGVLNVQ